jgi:isopenicillin N synthase-like dioxygenase
VIPIVTLADLEAERPEAVDRLHASFLGSSLVHVDARGELGAGFFAGLYEQTVRFFELPAADKQALDIGRSRHYRGYVGQGAEYTSGVPDLKESFEFGMEAAPPAGPRQEWFDLYGGNQWPDEERLPGFRPVINDFLTAMTRVAAAVLTAMLRSLGQPADRRHGLLGGELCCFSRLIHYRHPDGFAGQATRLARHTDSGMITIGLQNAPGLEVELADGGWLPVDPPDDVFTVFPGELAEVWTGGYYRACAHRVRNAALRAERLSYASFILPDLRRGLAPIDPASCPRLAAAARSVASANSWVTGGAQLSADIPVGQLEWQRMNMIFPRKEAEP